jgi:hypothetical protein
MCACGGQEGVGECPHLQKIKCVVETLDRLQPERQLRQRSQGTTAEEVAKSSASMVATVIGVVCTVPS